MNLKQNGFQHRTCKRRCLLSKKHSGRKKY